MTTTPPPAAAYQEGQAVHVRGTIVGINPDNPDYTYRVALPDDLALWFPASALAAPPAPPAPTTAGSGTVVRLGTDTWFHLPSATHYEYRNGWLTVQGVGGDYGLAGAAAAALKAALDAATGGAR